MDIHSLLQVQKHFCNSSTEKSNLKSADVLLEFVKRKFCRQNGIFACEVTILKCINFRLK